ncbi:MAG: c-type cytochrome [Mariprofundaceae bacterium]|nr:c-type cytochrome [Mariprofundaceae bacterium]
MKRLMLISAAMLLTVSWMAPSSMAGEVIGNPDKGRVIFESGVGDNVPACAGCHGTGGLGADDMGTPRLAYQVQKYIWKQLEDFASDKRMDNTMYQMNDIAKALSEEQRRDVAAYVHTLRTPFLGSDLNQMIADGDKVGVGYKGQILVEYGIPSRGIPACMSCHGFHGRSAGNLFPAIGGQRYVYLKHELEAFRAGHDTPSSEDDASRDNDPMAIMRNVAFRLTDEDIANVATFLTATKATTIGNPGAPAR